MTQLLIRRSVFDQVGLFRTDFGPIGDNEWEMRATLVFNTLHIPETLATWRIHSNQLTAPNNDSIPSFYDDFRKMIKEAFKASLPKLRKKNPDCYKKISMHRLFYPYTQRYITLSLAERKKMIDKILFILASFFKEPKCTGEYLYRRIFRKLLKQYDFDYIQKELKRLGLEKSIEILE